MIDRTPKERDDVIFAIKELHRFYSKPIPEPYEIKFWMNAFSKFNTKAVVAALVEAPGGCKYFPRPYDVVDILKGYRDAKGARYQRHENRPQVKCDPKIAYAWSRFIRMHSGMSPVKVSPAGISMSDEEVIELCNKEAIKNKIPDAIPDKYKLFDLWDAVHKPPVMGTMDMLL